jgi:hypothetical protein
MRRKIPPEAFSFYLGLGQVRSYDAVAAHYRVTKRAVTNLAVKERWQEKLEASERQARAKAEEKAQESVDDMKSRHLKTMQLVQRKALDALRSMPLTTAMDAVKALAMAVDRERLIRGEPTDHSLVSVEEIIKREYALLMVDVEEPSEKGRSTGAAQERDFQAAR